MIFLSAEKRGTDFGCQNDGQPRETAQLCRWKERTLETSAYHHIPRRRSPRLGVLICKRRMGADCGYAQCLFQTDAVPK